MCYNTLSKEERVSVLTLFAYGRRVKYSPIGAFLRRCACVYEDGRLCRPFIFSEFEIPTSGVVVIAATNAQHQLNDDIHDKEVRLIGENGEQMGIYSSADAIRIAAERNMDLVKISPQATPPVCKIMDYGKFRFEQSKREKEAKKNQHVVEVKEIRLTPNIGDNDFGWKLNDGKRFLAAGDRLKVTVRFRKGRELAHTDIGKTVLDKFAAECADIANIDKNPKLEGRFMSMFLSPKTGKSEKAETEKSQKKPEKEVAQNAEN